MSADQFIQYLSWATFLVLFIIVAVRLVREPRPAALDIALFFSVPALLIIITVGQKTQIIPQYRFISALMVALVLGLGYLLLRLVGGFALVPTALMRGAAGALVLLGLGAFVLGPQRPGWYAALVLFYIVLSLLYSTTAFVREAATARGVTRRRAQAAAAGSLLLVLLFLLGSLVRPLPDWVDALNIGADLAGLGAGIMYFLGFAPPRWMRRVWQEPELRAFLSRAASIPRLGDTPAILRELELAAATSIGAPSTRIGLWDATAEMITFPLGDAGYRLKPDDPLPAARAFREQRAVMVDDLPGADPQYAALSQRYGMKAILAAPISAAGRRFGVLVAYAPHALIFAEDDLSLIQLLADQAAVILEIRALIDEVAQAQASAEATRLKEDFLSAAAHDLKTPLTTLIARAQLLERAAQRRPDAPADLKGLHQIVQEGQRLRRFVLELLDATRVEQGRLVGEKTELDLVVLAEEVCSRHHSEIHPCQVASNGPALIVADQLRLTQLLENLVENAITYSPQGGVVVVEVGAQQDEALLTVTDHGIGIVPAELPLIFERFYRGTAIDARHFAGLGLGLYICRGIAEQHGGRIWAQSRLGLGSTFQVALPRGIVMEEQHEWSADSRN